MTAPLLLAALYEAAFTDIVLETLAFSVGKVGEFHRLADIVEDHRRTEAGSEAEEQHAPALIAAEGLHQRVVDHLDRLAELSGEIEAGPALAEIHGIEHRLVLTHGARIAHRDNVVGQAVGELLHLVDHLPWRQ